MGRKQERAWPTLTTFRFSSLEADAKRRAEIHMCVDQESWDRGPGPGVLISPYVGSLAATQLVGETCKGKYPLTGLLITETIYQKHYALNSNWHCPGICFKQTDDCLV